MHVSRKLFLNYENVKAAFRLEIFERRQLLELILAYFDASETHPARELTVASCRVENPLYIHRM